MLTRREFIKTFGIALASLLATRCTLPGAGERSPRDRLRACWLRFGWLAERTRDWDHAERGEEAMAELISDHRTALDEVVSAGELETAVADQVHVAYRAAAYHVWRSNAAITCYEPVEVDYKPTSSSQLAQQAALLAELAGETDLDTEVVRKAQAAVERDIAFLNAPPGEVEALYDEILKRWQETGIPSFDDVPLEISPEAVDAAAFLVALLLEE